MRGYLESPMQKVRDDHNSTKNVGSMQTNVIIQGDCIEKMKALPDASIDLIFADPPYWMRVEGELLRPEGSAFAGCFDDWDNSFKTNNEYNTFTKDWLCEVKRILKANGSFWVIGGMQCIYTIGAIAQELGFWFINDVIWQKANPTPNFLGTRLANSHETLLWMTKSKTAKHTFNYKTAKELNIDPVQKELFDRGTRKQLGSIWKIPVASGNERLKNAAGKKLHSTQKPEALLYRIIAISSKKGNIVLDPFGGTMTTAAMAKRLGRKYIMIEQNAEYIEAGKKRLETIQGEESDIADATFDIKPKKISLTEMIANGFLNEGEVLFLRNTDFTAVLINDGKVNYDSNISDIHSLCAKLKGVKAKRLNGFDWWYVLRDNKKVLLRQVREKARAALF